MGLTKTPTTILEFYLSTSGEVTSAGQCTQVDLTKATQWALTVETYGASGIANPPLVRVYTSTTSGADYDTTELTSFEGEVASEAIARKTVYVNPDALYAKVTVQHQDSIDVSGRVISTVQELT